MFVLYHMGRGDKAVSYTHLDVYKRQLREKMHLMLGLDAKIQLVSPNTLQRFEGKAKRVTDLRKKDQA